MTAHPLDLLPGYVLGDLEAPETETVEVHLLGCPSCRAEVARLRDALFSLADDLPAATLRDGLWEQIQARRQPARPLRVRRPVPLRPWLAAAVVLLALGGYTATRLTPPQPASVSRWEAQGARRLILTSREGRAFGTLLVRPDGQALVVLDRPAPAGQVYQAWGRTGGAGESGPTSLGLTGGTVMQVTWTGFNSVGISVEPAGGSPAPTRPLGRVNLAGI